MRQAGIIAAGSLYAFEHNIHRLADDHERALALANGLSGAGYAVEPPETNIVFVETERPDEMLRALASEGVLATLGKPGTVRLCTHLDVGDGQIQTAVEAAARAAGALRI